jgi:hypothetical protein
MRPIEVEELLHLFDEFDAGQGHDSSIRLETLQHYDVPGDEERQRAFAEGKPLPARPGKQATLDGIQRATAAGRRYTRVHVIDLPPSPYVRYEMAAYAENSAAGERVLLLDRAADPGLDRLRTDFNLFDGRAARPIAVFYRYTPTGRLIGWELSDDPTVIADCRTQVDLAIRFAMPLGEFTAGLVV